MEKCIRIEEFKQVQKIGTPDPEAVLKDNEGLVRKIANSYLWCGENMREDLLQEGRLGLLQALENYRSDGGAKFSTYARSWVKRNIVREIAKNGFLMKLPEEEMLLLNRVRDARASVWENEQRDASAEEIAQLVNISLKKAREALLHLDMVKYSVALDAPISAEDSDGETMAAIIPNRKDGFAEMFAADMAVSLRKFMRSRLTALEFELLRLYHGLDGDKPMSLEKVARLFGFSRTKAYNIEKQAYAKLLADGGEQFLRDCLAAA